MIPYTEACGQYTRVPPITNTPNLYHMSQNLSSSSSSTYPTPQNTLPSRRGRRSNVPPEIREQTRRLKKQNMERRRRACISDKMNALHNLAMNLIGIDPNECHKVEKADILNLCQSVFEGITNIVKDEPELKARLRKLRHNLNKIPTTAQISSTSTSLSSSSSSLVASKTDSTSNVDENVQNMNENDSSLRKSTPHTHHHRSHRANHHHSYSTTNITSNTQLSSTPTISSSKSSPLSSRYNCDQIIDEDNKENRIPSLIIRNTSLNGNYNTPHVHSTYVDGTTSNLTPISTMPVSSSSFSSCSVMSTPMSSRHLRVSERMMQWQHSTPLHCNEKDNLLLDNSDSGFCSSNQSLGLTGTVDNLCSVSGMSRSMDSRQYGDLCRDRVSKMDEVSRDVFSSSGMRNLSSLPRFSLSSDNELSAFSVPPVRKSNLCDVNQSVGSSTVSARVAEQDKKSMIVDSTSCTREVTCSSTEASSVRDPIVWRPYLD
ncbi:unnamed protein product [Schistosoma turkestanicum]|nr:unnamed protein product [Schistosoma turkestanicum]